MKWICTVLLLLLLCSCQIDKIAKQERQRIIEKDSKEQTFRIANEVWEKKYTEKKVRVINFGKWAIGIMATTGIFGSGSVIMLYKTMRNNRNAK